jgi:hypothetical protein
MRDSIKLEKRLAFTPHRKSGLDTGDFKGAYIKRLFIFFVNFLSLSITFLSAQLPPPERISKVRLRGLLAAVALSFG